MTFFFITIKHSKNNIIYRAFCCTQQNSKTVKCSYFLKVKISSTSTFSLHSTWFRFIDATNTASTTSSPHHQWCRIRAKRLLIRPVRKKSSAIGKTMTQRHASGQLLSYQTQRLMAQKKGVLEEQLDAKFDRLITNLSTSILLTRASMLWISGTPASGRK